MDEKFLKKIFLSYFDDFNGGDLSTLDEDD